MTPAILLIAGVIGTDVGAYFAGRTFGGPKIAPKISPSKTWSGLIGRDDWRRLADDRAFKHSYIGAGWMPRDHSDIYLAYSWPRLALTGLALAVVAQIGDFFESWMKRRAGVKDSGAPDSGAWRLV